MNINRNDFEKQWQRRMQASQNVKNDVPSDDFVLNMAKMAQQQGFSEGTTFEQPRRRLRWLPYAAAASLLIGVTLFSLPRHGSTLTLPVAEEVNVDGQTIHFLCNSGCSPNEVVNSAQKIMIQ